MSYVAGFGVANCDLFFTGVPRVPREGEEVYSGGFAMRPGGGVPATMTILGRLGVRAHLETFLGGDPFSRLVEDELKRGGVEYHNLYRGAAGDSTGAGDAFLAGLMYGLYHAKPITQSIAYGNVTGGACVQQLGCLTAFVDEPTLLREAALLRPEG